MALLILFVGIDVSKAFLDVWIESRKSSERFDNDPEGWNALIDRLAELGPAAGVVVAFEVTRGYERGLRGALLHAGLQVRRLNPARVRLYARSLGQLAKNDRIDARVIARYPQSADLHSEVLDPARERLADLVARRRRLIDERTAIGRRGPVPPRAERHGCSRLRLRRAGEGDPQDPRSRRSRGRGRGPRSGRVRAEGCSALWPCPRAR